MHSEKYEMVRRFYKTRMWNEIQVKNAVVKGWITEEEFEEITGNDYVR